MKKTAIVLHVFEGKRTYGQAYVAININDAKELKLSASIDYEDIRPENKAILKGLTAPKDTIIVNCGIIKTQNDVGDVINVLASEYEGRMILSVKGYEQFVKEFKASINKAETNSIASIIKDIDGSETMNTNQLMATVMIKQAKVKERWATYQNSRGSSIQRAGVTVADTSLTAQDINP